MKYEIYTNQTLINTILYDYDISIPPFEISTDWTNYKFNNKRVWFQSLFYVRFFLKDYQIIST